MLDLDVDIIGVSVLLEADELKARVKSQIERVIDTYSEVEHFTPTIHIDDTFLEPGYGIMTDGVRTAIDTFAKMEQDSPAH